MSSKSPTPHLRMHCAFHFLIPIFIMTLAAWRLVFTIVLKPSIQMLQLKSALKSKPRQYEQAMPERVAYYITCIDL